MLFISVLAVGTPSSTPQIEDHAKNVQTLALMTLVSPLKTVKMFAVSRDCLLMLLTAVPLDTLALALELGG